MGCIPILGLPTGGLGELRELEDSEVFGPGRVAGVYCIQADDDGPVKIGMALDVGRRFDTLQTAHYEDLYIRLILRPENPTTASLRTLEGRVHAAFSRFRIRGEWFEFFEPVAAFVDDPLRGARFLIPWRPRACGGPGRS